MLQRTALQADWPVETVIAMGRSPWGDGRPGGDGGGDGRHRLR
jgi:ABC-type hemin transport system ATPase subunit